MAQVNSSYFNYENGENLSTKLEKAVQDLEKRTDIEQFFTDDTAKSAFLYIGKLVAFKTTNINYEQFEKHNFHLFIGELMSYLFTKRHELDFKTSQIIELSSAASLSGLGNTSQTKIAAFKVGTYVTNLIASNSVHFARNIQLTGALKAYLDFLNDDQFVKANLNVDLNMWGMGKNNIIEYLVLNLGAFSRVNEEVKQKWIKLDAVNILIKTAKIKEEATYSSYTAITNTADDTQIEQLEEVQIYLKMNVDRLKLFHDGLLDGSLKRSHRQVFENNIKYNVETLSVIFPNNTSTSVNVVINSLYRLAINQKKRDDIYFTHATKQHLHLFLVKGNMYEKKLVSRLLAQLSFNKEIAMDLSNDQRYMSLIKQIANNKPSSDKHAFELDTFTNCSQIVWNINEATKPEMNEDKPTNQESTETDSESHGHIMISYNTGSREMCLKVKNELEASGYKVWMDVSDIHGSSLDSMAKAVEDSCVVLMCVTEKYRQSVNCQSEAQYAFKMGRPIIPCIMQKGYENTTGWLGIIMGDKIFVHFMKYEFPECMRRLKGEIDVHYRAAKKPSQAASSQPTTQTSSNSPQTWSSAKLNEWFADKNIHQGIFNYIKNLDGKVLHQIYVILIRIYIESGLA
jgi:hypothetical protein